MPDRSNILILCTGNSCRSQMAEGLLRHLAGDRFDVYSAGTDPKWEVHPLAVRVMNEIGIDMSGHRPKSLERYLGRLAIQHLIIVCDGANATCPPIWPMMQERHHWPFDDPAAFVGDEEQTLDEFRRVRDEIRERLIEWLPTALLPIPRRVDGTASAPESRPAAIALIAAVVWRNSRRVARMAQVTPSARSSRSHGAR